VKVLFVSRLARDKGSTSSIVGLGKAGRSLGHEVALFGDPAADIALPFSQESTGWDLVVFVVHGAKDFPGLPYIGELLDRVPKQRRVLIDCAARYNQSITVEHDANHLEALDGHQAWEWGQAFDAVASKVLQPTLTPRRPDVRPFLFHGFEPANVVRSYESALEAAASQNGSSGAFKRYSLAFVGNNFQKWTQLRPVLEALERIDGTHPISLVGRDWASRPKWAVSRGIAGIDVDSALLQRLSADIQRAVPFHEVLTSMSAGLISPVIHRPLFTHLGLVTTRTFETFCADAIPLLLLPETFVEALYGPAALPLTARGDLTAVLEEMLRRPAHYWEAVLATRAYLTEHHSYERRWRELLAIAES